LGYAIVAPGVTTSDLGIKWLQDFTSLCPEVKFRNLNIHHYSISADQLIAAVNHFHGLFGLNIWVGEVGCTDYSGGNKPCTQAVFDTFYTTAVDFLENCPFVEMYAWFGMFTPNELPNGVDAANSMITCPTNDNKKCIPNALGQRYLNARP